MREGNNGAWPSGACCYMSLIIYVLVFFDDALNIDKDIIYINSINFSTKGLGVNYFKYCIIIYNYGKRREK
jgi:ubiquitin C-terminal hydrolase